MCILCIQLGRLYVTSADRGPQSKIYALSNMCACELPAYDNLHPFTRSIDVILADVQSTTCEGAGVTRIRHMARAQMDAAMRNAVPSRPVHSPKLLHVSLSQEPTDMSKVYPDSSDKPLLL